MDREKSLNLLFFDLNFDFKERGLLLLFCNNSICSDVFEELEVAFMARILKRVWLGSNWKVALTGLLFNSGSQDQRELLDVGKMA